MNAFWCKRGCKSATEMSHAALEAAAPDLDRLARYERRAWFRQKRAIYNFMNLKLQQRSKESDEIPPH
jgi:hypothetical protein